MSIRTLLESMASKAKEAPQEASGGRSSCNQGPSVFLKNYLLIKGHRRELQDESLEILASALPQGRQSVEEYQNIILGFIACGWKCPVKS